MIDYKIGDDDLLRLLNSYKDENNYLKAQNEDLRGEIAYLKNQLANNSKRSLPTITQDDNLLSKQKSDEAWKFLCKNDFDSAIKLCDKALELNPDNFFAYNNRGRAYYNLRQYERAIQDFNKAIELNPNDGYAYNNRGCSYKALGKDLKANNDFAKAKELGWNG